MTERIGAQDGFVADASAETTCPDIARVAEIAHMRRTKMTIVPRNNRQEQARILALAQSGKVRLVWNSRLWAIVVLFNDKRSNA